MTKLLIVIASLLSLRMADAQIESQYIAYFHGGNEVPPSTSPFTGIGYFGLEGDTLVFDVQVLFPDPYSYFLPSGAGICGPAGRGTNGPLIFDWPTYEFGHIVPSEHPPFARGSFWIEYSGSVSL